MNVPALIEKMLVLFFAMAAGFVCGKRGWLDDTANRTISRLVVMLTNPMLALSSVMGKERLMSNRQVLVLTGISFALILSCMLLSRVVVQLLHAEDADRGLLRFLFSFCNISYIMDILTESRSYDLICFFVIGQFYFCQISKHFFRCQVSSKKSINLLRFERNSGWFSYFIADIYTSSYNFTCSQFFHQLACTVNCSLCIVRVKTLLKFTGCICTKSDSLGRKTDAGSIEARRLKKNSFYIVCDHGILSTHDTCDADSLLTVTDHQNVLIHDTLLAIQCDEFLIFSCTAYNDLLICDGIQIICMHWLSKLFHYIVCDINQVVDRADSIGSQTSLHPLRGRTDLDIFYNSCTVTRAKLRILYSNLYIIGSFLIIFLNLYNRRAEFLLEGCCCLSCDSKNTVAVYTVGSDLILKYHIVKAKCLNSALTHNCVLRKNIDSVFRCFRIHFSCASQLFDGTHHTIGIDSAKFSFFDFNSTRCFLSVMSTGNTSAVKNNRNLISLFYIRSACNNLYSLCSDIHLADDQFICIRMFLNFFNLTDHDLIQICVQFFKAFHFCSCQCHGICIFLCRYIQIRHICFNPR